jgi:hypothetical protein
MHQNQAPRRIGASIVNEIIKSVLTTDFEQRLCGAAHRNLVDLGNPLRLNNFAYALRELTRHVLHRLAPTDLVVKCSWYRNETDKPCGVTRRQRATYAAQGGLTPEYVRDVLDLEIEETYSALVAAINNLNKLTHIEEEVFDIDPILVAASVRTTEEAFVALCSDIKNCRQQVLFALQKNIDEEIVKGVLSDTILAIDELATHHQVDEIDIDQVEVTQITHNQIVIVATGSLEVELQYGSNSDIRRGDGAAFPDSFPFTCYLCSGVEAPDQVQVRANGLLVDTSAWSDED